MDLGLAGDPRAQRCSPGRHSHDQEYGLEKLQVVLGAGFRHPDGRGCGGDIQYLTGSGGEDSEKAGEHLSLTDAAQLEHITLDDKIEVVREPA